MDLVIANKEQATTLNANTPKAFAIIACVSPPCDSQNGR
jgi:hypothetical protein